MWQMCELKKIYVNCYFHIEDVAHTFYAKTLCTCTTVQATPKHWMVQHCRDGDQQLSRTEVKDEMIRIANVDRAFDILDTDK